MSPDHRTPPRLGLFDIMQVDPVAGIDTATMFAQRLEDLAYADELGFEVAFTAERHFLPQFAASSATAWIAATTQRTRRMRLGVMGYTLPIKAPVQLAEDIAILDLLSGGRLEVGFGIGHRVEELMALGVDPAQRITLFQERLALLKALFSGGQVTFERGDIRIRDVFVAPLPEQVPHPPLWFAGTEPIAAHWMGANGLGLAMGFKPNDQLAPAVTAFLEGRESRPADSIEAEPARPVGAVALMRSVIVGESDQRVRAEVIDDLMRLEEVLKGEQPEGSRGTRRQSAEDQFDTMIATGVMIAGSAETVGLAILEGQRQLHFDLFLANVHAMGANTERIRTSLRLLAGPVREQLQAQAAGNLER